MQIVLSVTVMLVNISVAIMHVTVPVAIMQLEVSAALMQVTVSASNMWVIIFIVFMQVGVYVAITQVVLSAMHNCFYCKMQFTVSVIAMQVTIYSFLLLTPTFHKIDRKMFKDIISGLHFITFVNILPKLRYFGGRNYTQIG